MGKYQDDTDMRPFQQSTECACTGGVMYEKNDRDGISCKSTRLFHGNEERDNCTIKAYEIKRKERDTFREQLI